MLGNATNNYSNLVGSLSRLNSDNGGRADNTGQRAQSSADFSNSINNANSGFMSAFSGFEQQMGQRYSMPGNQTTVMLQMLIEVLDELIDFVVDNTSKNYGSAVSGRSGEAAKSVSAGNNSTGREAQGSAEKQNAAGRFSANHAGQHSVNNAGATESAQSGDNASAASGSEAAQTSKSGGCPFMAAEPDQSSTGGSDQGQGAAGAAGNQGNQSAGGSAGAKPAGVGNADKADNRDIDFSNLSQSERSDMGLGNRERAVVHLWGRQMMSGGEQNGGIYTNVLGADGTGSEWGNKEEVALVKELRAQEKEKFGTDTGWMLDEAYFEIMKDKTGVDMSARYADRPVHESKGSVDITNDISTLEQRTGLSGFEQGVMRLMGHDALMDGQFDGSVLEYTAGNANSLDSNKHSGGNAVDDIASTLLAQDKADDGEVNGSSIMNETVKTLDRLYK